MVLALYSRLQAPPAGVVPGFMIRLGDGTDGFRAVGGLQPDSFKAVAGSSRRRQRPCGARRCRPVGDDARISDRRRLRGGDGPALRPTASAGRLILMVGGVADVLVAVSPERPGAVARCGIRSRLWSALLPWRLGRPRPGGGGLWCRGGCGWAFRPVLPRCWPSAVVQRGTGHRRRAGQPGGAGPGRDRGAWPLGGAKVHLPVAAGPYRQGPRQRDRSAVNVPGTMTRTAAGDGVGRAEMQEQVIELLRALARSLRRQHVRLAAGQGFPLSGPYLALLQQIGGHPGVTVSELARLTGLPKSRVSVLMTRLVAERIVSKDPDDHDSRLVLLNITPGGRRHAAEWSAASRQAIGRLLQPLCDDELVVIASGLTTLQRAFQEAEEQGTEKSTGGAPSC